MVIDISAFLDFADQRNGYRERAWDTRVGTIDLRVPRARDGSYFPSLLEPRKRAERALVAVVGQKPGVNRLRPDVVESVEAPTSPLF